MENRSNLAINSDVIENMATIAVKEVEGVAGLTEKGMDLKNVLNNAKTVAENVQKNVKEKLQSMTGNAITRVDVTIDDIAVE